MKDEPVLWLVRCARPPEPEERAKQQARLCVVAASDDTAIRLAIARMQAIDPNHRYGEWEATHVAGGVMRIG